MAVSRTVSAGTAKAKKRPARPASHPVPRSAPPTDAVRIGDLSEFLGYSLKRAQLRIFDDFIRCVAALQLTPAQFSVLMLVDANPGRNQTEIASTLGILRPNFVAMLDELESRELCLRVRSDSDRRSHILKLTDKGRAVLSRARKLIETRHEARLKQLLGDDNRDLLLVMLGKIAQEF
jgi:DNA-binding MarR family transcriptional regulator